MTQFRWLLTILMLVFAMLVSACPKPPGGGMGGAGGGMMSGPPPVPVVVAPVMMQEYAPALDLVGEIRATQRATLTAEVGGRVVGIAHRVGDAHSRSSGALITIDPSTYSAVYAAAEAQLAQAGEMLNKANTGARDQEIGAQRAQVDAARANHKLALDNLERQRELFVQGVISESMMVAAELQADSARAGLEAAEQMLDTLIEGTRKEDIAGAEAAVLMAESSLQAAGLNLARTAVKPAFDCVVSGLFVEVGSFVGPGSPLVEVVSTGPGEAWFNLPEDEAASAATGDIIEIRANSMPGEVFSGTVITVSPAADMATRQFPMRVALSDPRLKPGMAVDGRLLRGLPQQSIFVSSDATVKSALGVVAYVMTPPAAEGELPGVEMVPVVTGETIDDMVVVLEGNLQPGQMVVTRGNEQLYPGAKIIPTNLMGEGGMGGGPGGPPPGAGESGDMAPAAGDDTAAEGEMPPAGTAEPGEPGAH